MVLLRKCIEKTGKTGKTQCFVNVIHEKSKEDWETHGLVTSMRTCYCQNAHAIPCDNIIFSIALCYFCISFVRGSMDFFWFVEICDTEWPVGWGAKSYKTYGFYQSKRPLSGHGGGA